MKKWDQERQLRARLLYESGKTIQETARELKTDPGTCAIQIRAAGGTIVTHRDKRRKKTWTPDRQLLARQMYEQGKTLQEISDALGSTLTRCSNAIREAGGTIRGAGPPHGERNPSWNGGRQIDKSGYVLVRVPSHPHANNQGYVREHRLVMEQILGRYLLPTEVVHHLNSDTGDNRPENLELFESNGKHLAHELAGRCPRWSEEGRARIRAAVSRKRDPKL